MEDIRRDIDNTKTLKAINELRRMVVKNMRGDNGLLEYWQKKYWSIKKCSKCGHITA